MSVVFSYPGIFSFVAKFHICEVHPPLQAGLGLALYIYLSIYSSLNTQSKHFRELETFPSFIHELNDTRITKDHTFLTSSVDIIS